MDGMDWSGLARNALWIVGLGIVLAAASHASWWASVSGARPDREAEGSNSLAPISAGLLLVTLSLAWGAPVGWERILWAAASLAFAWQILGSLRRRSALRRRRRNLVE